MSCITPMVTPNSYHTFNQQIIVFPSNIVISEKVVFAKMSIFNCPQIKNFIANEANSVLVYNDNPNKDMYTTY